MLTITYETYVQEHLHICIIYMNHIKLHSSSPHDSRSRGSIHGREANIPDFRHLSSSSMFSVIAKIVFNSLNEIKIAHPKYNEDDNEHLGKLSTITLPGAQGVPVHHISRFLLRQI